MPKNRKVYDKIGGFSPEDVAQLAIRCGVTSPWHLPTDGHAGDGDNRCRIVKITSNGISVEWRIHIPQRELHGSGYARSKLGYTRPNKMTLFTLSGQGWTYIGYASGEKAILGMMATERNYDRSSLCKFTGSVERFVEDMILLRMSK